MLHEWLGNKTRPVKRQGDRSRSQSREARETRDGEP